MGEMLRWGQIKDKIVVEFERSLKIYCELDH